MRKLVMSDCVCRTVFGRGLCNRFVTVAQRFWNTDGCMFCNFVDSNRAGSFSIYEEAGATRIDCEHLKP